MKIAVLGYGTVGSGVVEVLEKNQELIAGRAGESIEVKYVLARRDYPDDEIQERIVHDFQVILQDDEIEIVVEALNGTEPAYTYVKSAILAGKHVVTPNKALVAEHGVELLKLAKEKNLNFLFEASVAGGIPILRALQSSLTAEDIEEVAGILNGTTNYMITKMFCDGADYAEVLKEAQEKGFAEADPTADVEGHDACRKIAILASIITGKFVDYREIYTEGISNISAEDMMYARELGMTIKLLAICKKNCHSVHASVAPVLLKNDHPLYPVNGVFNAVFVKGNMLGDAMFYGGGAGKLPTASAVVADVIAVTKNREQDIMNTWTAEKVELQDKSSICRRFLVRVKGNQEEHGKQIQDRFGEVSFVKPEGISDEFGFVTTKMSEAEYEEKAKAFDCIQHMLRIEE